MDGGADTCLDGKEHLFLEYTERVANVVGFDDGMTKTNLHIGTSITVARSTCGNDVLLLKNEAIDHTGQSNSMLSVNQVRSYGIDIDDCPTQFQVDGRFGRQSMIVGVDEDGDTIEIPFDFSNNLINYGIREPTMKELEMLPMFCLTSDLPWDPHNGNNTSMNKTSSIIEGRCIVNPQAHQRVLNRVSTIKNLQASLKCYSGDSMCATKWSEIRNLVNTSNTSIDPTLVPKPVSYTHLTLPTILLV